MPRSPSAIILLHTVWRGTYGILVAHKITHELLRPSRTAHKDQALTHDVLTLLFKYTALLRLFPKIIQDRQIGRVPLTGV